MPILLKAFSKNGKFAEFKDPNHYNIKPDVNAILSKMPEIYVKI
jgi:hypothetical protein